MLQHTATGQLVDLCELDQGEQDRVVGAFGVVGALGGSAEVVEVGDVGDDRRERMVAVAVGPAPCSAQRPPGSAQMGPLGVESCEETGSVRALAEVRSGPMDRRGGGTERGVESKWLRSCRPP